MASVSLVGNLTEISDDALLSRIEVVLDSTPDGAAESLSAVSVAGVSVSDEHICIKAELERENTSL